MSDVYSEERALSKLPAAPPTHEEKRDIILHELHATLEHLNHSLTAMKPAASQIEDVDLVNGGNPGRPQNLTGDRYQAVQVDNPYAVTLEVHGTRDGGGIVLMRVPAHTSRVVTARGHEISLKAIGGNPAGQIPATVILFDRPQPAGLYPYAP